MLKKVLKVTVILSVLILLFDISYLLLSINKNKITYESINAYKKQDSNFIAVGSINKSKYEKAALTKYNKDYKRLWRTKFDSKYNSTFLNVLVDNDNYIAVGSYEADKNELNNKERSALIVKYTKDGKIVNKSKFQVLGNSKFTNVLALDDGYLVVGQSIYEAMTLGLSEDGGAFLIKYDKNLKLLWKKNYGGSKSAVYNDLIINNDYIYTVGKDFSNTAIISKYDMNGKIIKTITYDNTDTLGFTSITTDDDYLYVVGAKKINNKRGNPIIVKYNNNLEYISSNEYKTKGRSRYNKVIYDNNNLIVIGQLYKSKNTYKGLLVKYNNNLDLINKKVYNRYKSNHFTDINSNDKKYIVSSYVIKNNDYISKFIELK